MSAVELLAAGAKAASGTGSAVDVSAHAVLRLNGTFASDQSKAADLYVALDHGPSSSGPWTPLHEIRMRAGSSWRSADRIVLAGFDDFVRVRWEARVGMGAQQPDIQLAFGITGEGIPDA